MFGPKTIHVTGLSLQQWQRMTKARPAVRLSEGFARLVTEPTEHSIGDRGRVVKSGKVCGPFCRSEGMKFIIAILLCLPLRAFDPVSKEAADHIILTNVVRTAYLSIHGNLAGFNEDRVTSAVPALANPMGEVLVDSSTCYFRERAIRSARWGTNYHAWAFLLRQKRLARLILEAHYA